MRRHADRKGHHRGDRHGADRELRALERRSAGPGRVARWPHALALRPRLPAPSLPRHHRLWPLRRARRSGARHRRGRVRVCSCRPRGRWAAQLRAHGPDDRSLLEADRGSLSPSSLQPDHRVGFHLRRHGEHRGHHPHRSGPARRAGGPRPRRGWAGLSRAGPSVVGRSPDLSRVVRSLAQRRIRHLLRIRLARTRQGARRGRPRAAFRRGGVPRRGRAISTPHRVPSL